MIFTISAAAITAIVGCGNNSADADDDEHGPRTGITEVFTEEIDGEEVPCIRWTGNDEGGLSCDFEAPYRDTESQPESGEERESEESPTTELTE
ncbi:hypothetical protein RIF23_05205 [Lipingzhangella sp. LS1_29]|uniref:Secreted protein n=1 Tax=Lipingzhangella rawalii TaxID=2055835 RepID=A0ABU2H3V8_9ACTN|nr:hypothetical protein [Lipingzhangella rawalii]MDS1269687.1 hypothetical protein [Lipingzhangella rawalii]